MSAIQSLLDNDLYKLTMMQAVWLKQPEAKVRYQFINRRPSNRFTPDCVDRIREETKALCQLRFAKDELEFLRSQPFMRADFVDFLRRFQLDADHVTISESDGQLGIAIEGPWVDTILFEVPLMAIISQCYFETVDRDWNDDTEAYLRKTLEKGRRLSRAGCAFIEFGTRRRRTYGIQDAVVRAFNGPDMTCTGTSNVHFAMKYGMTPVGTMAHEWIMGYGGLVGVADANRAALSAWREVYGDQLGIALTDTYTTDLFMENIRGDLAKNYFGLRHDSECPLTFTDKVLAFYRAEGIDPKEKLLVFSDSLTVDKAIEIEQYVDGTAQTAYGIGTHFTNDFGVSLALNMVIKLFAINGTPVAKISDNTDKASGDDEAVAAALAAIEQATGAQPQTGAIQ